MHSIQTLEHLNEEATARETRHIAQRAKETEAAQKAQAESEANRTAQAGTLAETDDEGRYGYED